MVLTVLSLVIGYLTLSISVALLYGAWLSGAGATVTNEFLVFASVCSLGFATFSGWLTALVAQRAPITHAAGLSILLAVVWGFSTFGSESSEPLTVACLNLAIGVVGVMTGGWVRLRQMKARDAAEQS
ncbi:MAG: hypothetical protein AAFU53_12650 [Cyanobacteria bacterium J06632_3]